jgi:hypothetical protein
VCRFTALEIRIHVFCRPLSCRQRSDFLMPFSQRNPHKNGEPALAGHGAESNSFVDSGNSGDFMTRPEQAPAVFENPGRIWIFALAAALFASLAGWAAADVAEYYLHWDGRVHAGAAGGRVGRDPNLLRELARRRGDAAKMNTALAMGILGAALGLTFGAAGGLYRRSSRRATASGALGLFCGSAMGAAVPLLIVPWFYLNEGRPPNPSLPLFFHGTMYSAVGAAGGFVFGLGSSGWREAVRAALAAALGAVLGSIVYDVFQTVAFPLAWDFSPMPGTAGSRLLSHLTMSICSISCVVVASVSRRDDLAQPAANPTSAQSPKALSRS